MQIPFIGPSYVARSRNVAYDECINYYPENSEQGTAKNVRSLIGTPGLKLAAGSATVSAEGRGIYQSAGSSNNGFYGVVGNTLYLYQPNGTISVSIGTLTTTTGMVHFADSGTSQTTQWLLVVDGQNAYSHVIGSTTLTTLTLPTGASGAVKPTWCTFLDGYFIINDKNTLTCYRSAQWDASTWAATADAVFTVESTPDNVNAVIAHDGNIWAFGPNSHEVFYNAGSSASQQFLRIQGTPSDVGCIAKHSIAYNGSALFWVGNNRFGSSGVYMSQGFDGVPVSTPSIENDLEGKDITDAVGYCYSQEGHNFYVVNFPTHNKTWVFDSTTGYWHRRTYLNNGNEDRHRVISGFNFNSDQYQSFVLGQDWGTGWIYEIKLDHYTDNTVPIRRVRSCPTIHQDRKRLSFSSFQVDMETGTGLQTGQGSDPKGIVQVSNDSGHTFGNEIEASTGKIGNYAWRFKVNRLGQAYDRVFRFVCTEPIKQVLIGGFVEASLDG